MTKNNYYRVGRVYGNRWGVFGAGRLDMHFPTEADARTYADIKQQQRDCVHQWVYLDDEYGSLGDGGSYEIYRCVLCGKKHYSPMAD